MYAVYHGPEGIKEIAEHVHNGTLRLAEGMCAMVNSCVYECNLCVSVCLCVILSFHV